MHSRSEFPSVRLCLQVIFHTCSHFSFLSLPICVSVILHSPSFLMDCQLLHICCLGHPLPYPKLVLHSFLSFFGIVFCYSAQPAVQNTAGCRVQVLRNVRRYSCPQSLAQVRLLVSPLICLGSHICCVQIKEQTLSFGTGIYRPLWQACIAFYIYPTLQFYTNVVTCINTLMLLKHVNIPDRTIQTTLGFVFHYVEEYHSTVHWKHFPSTINH